MLILRLKQERISKFFEKSMPKIMNDLRRIPKKLIDIRTIKRKADCCLLLGAIEKAYTDLRSVADALKSQNDTIWHAGLVKTLSIIRISRSFFLVF